MLNENIETKPFKIILDMLAPFIGIDEFLAMNPTFYDEIKRFFSCLIPYRSKGYLIETNKLDDTSETTSSSDDHGHNINNNNYYNG